MDMSNVPTRVKRRAYVSVRAKFAIAVVVGLVWTMFSVRIADGWIDELGALTHPLFSLVAISFIAFIPGFMNAFLVTTLLLDRRPLRTPQIAYPGVTVLVAAYQEEAAIADTIRSVAAADYCGLLEILVLNDGSRDRTSALARSAIAGLSLPPHVLVELVDFPVNRGKSAVLNDGLARAKHSLVVTVDGDSWLMRDSLTQIVERLLSDPPDTVAVAGAVLVRNSRVNLMTAAQEWDYFHGIAAVKRMQSMYHGTLVAQGAFSIYRTEALKEVGGWPDCVGEDIVVTWAMLEKGWRVGYAEDALVFTNAPTTFGQFAQQRKRWSRGLVEALRYHESLIFKPRLTTLFIWWNLLFLPLDLIYTFVFIPGVVMALLFGQYWIAGPMTLAILPLAGVWNLLIFRIQRGMFRRNGLTVRRNALGMLFYMLVYALMMQPVCVWGYASELAGRRKSWGTK